MAESLLPLGSRFLLLVPDGVSTSVKHVSYSSPVSLPHILRHDGWSRGRMFRDAWLTDARCFDVLPGGMPRLMLSSWLGQLCRGSGAHWKSFPVRDVPSPDGRW
jgi:hypothetical protein